DYLFPGPLQVFDALRHEVENLTLFYANATSLRRFVLGFSVSLVIGIGLGLFIGSIRVARETVGVLLVGLQSLPNIAWLPMGLLWVLPHGRLTPVRDRDGGGQFRRDGDRRRHPQRPAAVSSRRAHDGRA